MSVNAGPSAVWRCPNCGQWVRKARAPIRRATTWRFSGRSRACRMRLRSSKKSGRISSWLAIDSSGDQDVAFDACPLEVDDGGLHDSFGVLAAGVDRQCAAEAGMAGRFVDV